MNNKINSHTSEEATIRTQKFSKTLNKALIVLVASVQLTLPASQTIVLAQSSDGAGTSTQEASPPAEPCPVATGTQAPTGSSAVAFTFNPYSCLWENAYYTWNPITKVTTPLYNNSYILNPSTGNLDKTTWVYSPALGAYRAVVETKIVPVQTTAPGPDATISNTGPDSTNTINDPIGDTSINNTGPNSNNEANTGSIDTTGPDSNNVIDLDNDSSSTLNTNQTYGITNGLNSTSTTGNALIASNTTGGSALTGDAVAFANMLNMVQSSTGINGLAPNIYTANIQGDYVGDLIIDPGTLLGGVSSGTPSDLTVNSTIDASIENDIDLLAQSGSATVSNNTEAGDATTGDATAVANIINMINSSINTGQSFIGILNINGNYEGDVLLADDILDQLIASNVPQMSLCITCNGDTTIDIDNDQTITNNITTTAQSGAAVVDNNTEAGNATTGDATTNVTVFNLTGTHVVAENALLVFVNVLGEWVGFITNAPQGATAAAVGSGVVPSSIAAPTSLAAENTEINIDNDFTIDNNIDVTAITGDATVASNTSAGNATTGNAVAAVNTANIANSTFGISNWFGMLFINVFGDWNGSFGTNTAFGNPAPGPIPAPRPNSDGSGSTGSTTNNTSNNTPSTTGGTNAVLGQNVRVFQISAINANGQININEAIVSATASLDDEADAENKDSVATQADSDDSIMEITEAVANSTSSPNRTLLFTAGGASILLLAGERLLAFFRRRA